MSKKVKVLVIDDSALIRMLLTKSLSDSDQIEVVGAAEDPLVARTMIKKYNPDVLTLDVEMPKMNGLTFLKNLMKLRPIPVVMVSTLTQKGASVTLKALEYGAIDFVAKPDTDFRENLLAYSAMLTEKVLAAAKIDVSKSGDSIIQAPKKIQQTVTQHSKVEIISIGASTGGTEAIKAVVSSLPTNLPPIVMAQHIPPVFSTSFAKRLDECSAVTVIEPSGKMALERGHAYLAPGDQHMLVTRIGGRLFLDLEHGEPVNRHRPSVDVLYDSVSRACGLRSIAILLTGMGTDGARGMKLLKDKGAHTIAQDKISSVVWGMPGAAVALGATTEVLSLDKIAKKIVSLV